MNILKFGIRGLVKSRFYTLISILGLSMGMATSILILLWALHEYSYDRFHENADRIFLVAQHQHYADGRILTVGVAPALLAQALQTEYPEISSAVRFHRDFRPSFLRYGDKTILTNLSGTDQSFFDMFSFHWMSGDKQTALTDPQSIVLTRTTALKLFGDEDPLGKTVSIDQAQTFAVTGVIDDAPENSTITFDCLVPFHVFEESNSDFRYWGSNTAWTYVLLRQGVDKDFVSRKIADRIQRAGVSANSPELFLFPMVDFHLHSLSGQGGRIDTVYLFLAIAAIILIVSCINYVNLTTARAATRSREVGLKKVLGAQRFEIAGHFFLESVLVMLAASFVSLLLVKALLPFLSTVSRQNLNSVPWGTVVVVTLAVGALAALCSGLYPAIHLSAFSPAQTLRIGKFSGRGHATVRRVLVVLQFCASTVIIIGTIFIFLQREYILNLDAGVKTEHVLYVPLHGFARNNIHAIKQTLLRDRRIAGVSAAAHLPLAIYYNGSNWNWEGKTSTESPLIFHTYVDQDYLKVTGIPLVEGTFYGSQGGTSDSSVARVVVNETFAHMLGKGPAAGKIIRSGSYSVRIIGVVKDFRFLSARQSIAPLLLWPEATSQMNVLMIKLSGQDVRGALKHIGEVQSQFNAGSPQEIHFLDDYAEQMYKNEEREQKLFSAFALLAIGLSCLGLFGLASFIVAQKTKEVGIRVVLGATTAQVVGTLAKGFLAWVILANILAWPVAYYLVKGWLNGYAYRVPMSWSVFLLSFLGILILALLTVSGQAVKAALKNPVDSLRYE